MTIAKPYEPSTGQTLWTYWEGDRPPVIQLCLDTMARHSPDFRLVDGPEGLLALDPEDETPQKLLDATADKMLPYRADLLRYWLLWKFGGTWTDADVVMMNALPDEWVDAIPDNDVVGTYNKHTSGKGWGINGLTATPVGGRQGSRFMEICFQRNLETFTNGKPIQYGSTSVGVQSSLFKKRKDEFKTVRFDHWKYNRVPWYRSGAFKQVARGRQIASFRKSNHYHRNACFYHLTNKMTDHFKEWTPEALVAQGPNPTFLQFLFQRALEYKPAIPGMTISILRRLPLHQEIRGAEIGCLMGNNASELLTQRPKMTLLMVDPWAEAEANYKATGDYMTRWGPGQWQNVYKAAMNRVAFAGERAVPMRGLSVDMAKQVPDASLDFVYIDANHSYEGCRTDIDAWLPKIKPGGFLSGHDFNHDKEVNKKKWGVMRAVNETATALGKEVRTGNFYSWFIEGVNVDV